MRVRTFVQEAELELNAGTNPAAVGAAVTVALCGHWEHEGPCRWPHNNRIDGQMFRTIFVAAVEEEEEIRRRIRDALRGNTEWMVKSDRAREVSPGEAELAARLLRAPRRPAV